MCPYLNPLRTAEVSTELFSYGFAGHAFVFFCSNGETCCGLYAHVSVYMALLAYIANSYALDSTSRVSQYKSMRLDRLWILSAMVPSAANPLFFFTPPEQKP
jgi:hypothetical protein